ncbi:MAG: hypothetical protein RL680_1000 [Actinomycetota bacterium]|jgi:hypothetical protein
MAISLSNAFVTLFDAEVKQAYQGKAMLVGAVRQRRNVEGSTVKFPKVGKGVATARVSQTDVTPMNVGFSTVTCTMSDWNAAEYSDIFSQAKVNFEERSELSQVVGAAIGRRQDQLILDALAAASSTGTVANSIGGTTTNMNISKLREAAKILNTKNVPSDGRHIIIHANSLASMLEQTSVTSSDFNTVKALVQGEISTYMGFQFHILGDRTEGGLPIDGSSDRTLYAFHRDAIGYAEGIAPKTEVNYIPEKTSWLINAIFSAGSVAIDVDGIVKITARDTAAAA